MRYSYFSWKKLFSEKQIKDINKKIKNNFVEGDDNHWGATKKAKVNFFKLKTLTNELEDLFQRIYSVNNYHFGYSLYQNTIYDLLNYNVYNAKDKAEYDWHKDIALKEFSDMKFTLLINLSEKKYEGGEFWLLEGAEPYIVKEFSEPGDVLLFKSEILHKVSPVKKGERISLAYFLEGPKFR
jgi:predicted 2-oxoglutarate/Fe(II)-dependent dioxygenase YbiX